MSKRSESTRRGAPRSDSVDRPDGYRIAVLLLDSDGTDATGGPATRRLVETAGAIARENDGGILLLMVDTFPDQTPLGLVREDRAIREKETALDSLRELTAERTAVPVQACMCLAHSEANAVISQIENHECDAVIFGFAGIRSNRVRLLLGSTREKLLARADCEVYVVNGEIPAAPERVLLAVADGPHSGLAAQTTGSLARAFDAHVDVLHVVDHDASSDDWTRAENVIRGAATVLEDLDSIDATVVPAADTANAIIERSAGYDLTVIGAPRNALLQQFAFGSIPESVTRESNSSVLITRQTTDATASAYYRWLRGDKEP